MLAEIAISRATNLLDRQAKSFPMPKNFHRVLTLYFFLQLNYKAS
jgi:hypothetical protein